MVKEKLTYKDVCTLVVDTYRDLLDNKKWPPARGMSDSKAPPAAFGNLANCGSDPQIVAQAFALLQQMQYFSMMSRITPRAALSTATLVTQALYSTVVLVVVLMAG